MLTFDNGGILIELEDPLPDLSGNELFFDTETTSFNCRVKSLNPWHNCWPLGICIKGDDGPAYYVPINHADNRCNRDPRQVQAWLVDVFNRFNVMIGHNIKYDAQVIYATLGIDTSSISKRCTLDLSYLIDSDRFQHSLDALSRDWLHEDISQYEEGLQPYLDKNQDYGHVPTDIMAAYGTQDVLTERRLWKYIQFKMPPESKRVMNTSNLCLDTLISIERNGMRVNPRQVEMQELLSLKEMHDCQTRITKAIGFTIDPASSKDCHDYICNTLGYPVLARNEPTKTNPVGSAKFDKNVLANYRAMPGAPVEVIDDILLYRQRQMFTSMFCDAWRELNIDGLLHPSYRQTVRTGRMACSLPNMQQVMAEAKQLIIPAPGNCIISADYSQIEFRVIVHYIQDAAAIAAYAADPFTDFHMWVKEMTEVDRSTAKTLNFMMGYGGGKRKLILALARQSHLTEPILQQIMEMDLSERDAKIMFDAMCQQRGLQVYNKYHGTLPRLKPTSKAAMNVVYDKGYVTNKYGRRRTLAHRAAWRAFNTVCQGTSADLMKDRLVALDIWLQTNCPELKLIGVVHDEVVLEGPAECAEDQELLNSICYILEDVDIGLRVPIRTSIGTSLISWYEASENSENRKFERARYAGTCTVSHST